MARRNVSLKGVSELTMKLKSNANMKDVKQIVKQNTAELTQGAQRKAPVDTGNNYGFERWRFNRKGETYRRLRSLFGVRNKVPISSTIYATSFQQAEGAV